MIKNSVWRLIFIIIITIASREFHTFLTWQLTQQVAIIIYRHEGDGEDDGRMVGLTASVTEGGFPTFSLCKFVQTKQNLNLVIIRYFWYTQSRTGFGMFFEAAEYDT